MIIVTKKSIPMAFEILTFGFMQRALISGIVIAIICSIIGLFLVLKRHSLFGDAMSHVAFGGIAIGLYTNVYPLWTAFIVSVLAALGMTKLREVTKIPADSAVAVLLSWSECKEHQLPVYSYCQHYSHCLDKAGRRPTNIVPYSAPKYHCYCNGQRVQENCIHLM